MTQRLHFFLIICVVLSLPFSIPNVQLNSFFILLLSANFILLVTFCKKDINIKSKKILILFILVYFIHVFGLFKSDNMHEAIFELQKKLSIFIFPLILLFSPKLNLKQVRVILLCFVTSCLLTGLFSLSVASYRFFSWQDSTFFFYHSLSGIVGMHGTYLSIYFCFSIVILLSIYFDTIHTARITEKIIYYFSLLTLTILVLLLAGRLQIIILVLGVIAYSLFYFHKKIGLFKSLILSVLIGGFILGSALLSPKIRDRFKEGLNYDIGNRWGEQQVRALIWSSAFELIKMNPITGVGTGDVQDELHKYYLSHEYTSLTYLENTKYNAHNQFLETAVGLGIPGLIVLLACFMASLVYAIKHRNILYFVFTIIFMISCMTESLLERQSGIVFYAFFNSFLYLNNPNKKDDERPLDNSVRSKYI